MRNYLVLLFSLFLTFESIAQKAEDITIEEDSVVEFPDIEASYPGGLFELHKFIVENLNFPFDCLENNFDSRIFITFIVEKDGSISNIEVNQKILGCEQLVIEAKRVLSLMPKWIPGEVQGVKKRVRVILPFNINLN